MFVWNPSREIFRIPYLDLPIFWYGLFFALSFYVSYYLFLLILTRYLSNFPEFSEKDVLDERLFYQTLDQDQEDKKKSTALYLVTKGEKISSIKKLLERINSFIQRERNWDDVALTEGRKKQTTLQKTFISPKKTALRLYVEKLFPGSILRIKDRARIYTDKLLVLVLFSTIIGARLAHLVFYERPAYYLSDPWIILSTWKGGLASHGAAFSIMVSVAYFSKKYLKKDSKITFLTILDLFTIPALFIGGWIRIGNFFNQEILGKPSSLPWAVAFGKPLDGSIPWIPRHPVQIYEAIFCFCLFGFLSFLFFRTKTYLKKGFLTGIFFTFLFTFRFFIEQFKEKQSSLLVESSLTMGQYLSLPFILLGACLLFYSIRLSGKKGFALESNDVEEHN